MKLKKWVRNVTSILFVIGLLIATGIADNSNINSSTTLLIYSTISIILSVPYILIFINDLKDE